MDMPVVPAELSRIDKLFLDRTGAALDESRRRRQSRGLTIRVGRDVKGSRGLQLALLTATNLGQKCFASSPAVEAAPDVFFSRCLIPVARSATLGEAVAEFGGRLVPVPKRLPEGRHLVLGDAAGAAGSVRLTFDAWRVAVGPANELPRMAERNTCPVIGMAAAAMGLAELFAEFAGISVAATRRLVRLSLWRPDLAWDDPGGTGEPLAELPLALALFGLGHLGQAYLWGIGALPYTDREKATLLLCDDDRVESGNVETGALLAAGDVDKLKTRVAANWLEARGFSTRLVERRLDVNFRRMDTDPVIALSGFDDNWPRRWLARAEFSALFDSGLGGEANNFDTIGFHAWPNLRSPEELWPVEAADEVAARRARRERELPGNAIYGALAPDECGRLWLAERAVAVPFVGALASAIVLAELLKVVNGGPTFSDLKARACSLGNGQLEGRLAEERSPPVRGLATQPLSRNSS